MKFLGRTGQKTATLAPETASPRMKKVIGKEIASERFYELVDQLVTAGIPNLRFYFMVGLPTETCEDVESIVDFVLQSRKIFVEASRPQKKIGKIGVQVNAFVPSPGHHFNGRQCGLSMSWNGDSESYERHYPRNPTSRYVLNQQNRP